MAPLCPTDAREGAPARGVGARATIRDHPEGLGEASRLGPAVAAGPVAYRDIRAAAKFLEPPLAVHVRDHAARLPRGVRMAITVRPCRVHVLSSYFGRGPILVRTTLSRRSRGEHRGDDGGGRDPDPRRVGLGVDAPNEHQSGRDGPAAGHPVDAEEVRTCQRRSRPEGTAGPPRRARRPARAGVHVSARGAGRRCAAW